MSRDKLEELLDFKRGITQRSQFPTNWLLAEGDGVFTFIRCRENRGGAMAGARFTEADFRDYGDRTNKYYHSAGCEAAVCLPMPA